MSVRYTPAAAEHAARKILENSGLTVAAVAAATRMGREFASIVIDPVVESLLTDPDCPIRETYRAHNRVFVQFK